MKYALFVLFITSSVWFLPPKKSLYVLYDGNSKYEYRIGNYTNGKDRLSFIYRIYYNYKGIQKVEISMNKRAEFETDTLSFSHLKSIDLKDYRWLEKSYLSYYHHFKGRYIFTDSTGAVRRFNLNKVYDNIYVVRLDSAKCRALVYRVSQSFIVE